MGGFGPLGRGGLARRLGLWKPAVFSMVFPAAESDEQSSPVKTRLHGPTPSVPTLPISGDSGTETTSIGVANMSGARTEYVRVATDDRHDDPPPLHCHFVDFLVVYKY